MSLADVIEASADARFPRVSGDEPPLGVISAEDVEFSPRERG